MAHKSKEARREYDRRPENLAKTRAYQKAYAARNAEKKRLAAAAWAAANPERAKAAGVKWRTENREKKRELDARWYAANREKQLAVKAEYRKANAEKLREDSARWYQANKVKKRAWSKRWLENNRDKDREYRRRRQQERLVSDPQFKIERVLRNRFRNAVGRGQKTGSVVALLGCTIAEFLTHIETQWTVGMLWETHGNRGWHLDHIVPLTAFDLTDTEQLARACHYTNFQPLWWRDNISKGGHKR